jgi:hypothetical protein
MINESLKQLGLGDFDKEYSSAKEKEKAHYIDKQNRPIYYQLLCKLYENPDSLSIEEKAKLKEIEKVISDEEKNSIKISVAAHIEKGIINKMKLNVDSTEIEKQNQKLREQAIKNLHLQGVLFTTEMVNGVQVPVLVENAEELIQAEMNRIVLNPVVEEGKSRK